MKGFVYAGALSAAIAATPVCAVSVDGYQLPAPQWEMEETHSGKAPLPKPQRKPTQRSHTDSLLQKQMRQLERLRQQAERDWARVKKLRQMLRKARGASGQVLDISRT